MTSNLSRMKPKHIRLRWVIVILFVLSLLFTTTKTLAQAGMPFEEFSRKLELYYDKEFVEDIEKQLPQGADFKVWGWDVGDFSGDGYNDVAFTIRLANDKNKSVSVYLFVDIEGYMNNVATYQYTFVDIPLEVGVAIKNNACYVTQKRKLYDWMIRGYRYSYGSVLLLDEYTTYRVDKYTKEIYHNYQTLRGQERFIQTSNNDVVLSSDFLTIPCYTRGVQVYKGYTSTTEVRSIDFVNRGSFYWSGEEDCSFTVRSAYDQNYLYVNINVRDDEVVTARCDTCPADNIDLWFDTSPPDEDGDRITSRKNKKLGFRTTADSNIYKVTLNLGDFLEVKPTVKVSSTETDENEVQQKIALQQITKKVGLRPSGYVVKVRIPWSLFGFSNAPVEDKSIVDLGCTVVVHDIDNEFRPEEGTDIATSQVQALNPSTFGSLAVVPNERFYGESTNIFTDALMTQLQDLGF